MSRISVDVSSARIPVLQVGYQGENEVTDVLFDISSWITEFGEGVAQLRVKRPGNSEEESYVLSLTITDGKAVWTVSETDTFNKGNGKVQLSYMVGNIVKKAVIYPYKVGKSIVGADNPVDPFDSWIERSKAWATGKTLDGDAVPETDETYQNNAKYYAEQADILGSAQVVLATEQATLATEKATLATVKADAAAESETNAAASEAAVNGVSTQLTNRMTAIETEQSVQSARMDTFTSLPEGSTSGNAELADIRVGANGTTYDTAGNAVRGQIGELKSDLSNLDSGAYNKTIGKNKFNEKTLSQGYLNNGSIVSNDNWKTTDFIDVSGFESVVFSAKNIETGNTYNASMFFFHTYDANKTLIKSVNTQSSVYSVEENVCYIRFAYEYKLYENPQLEEGSTRTSYEPYEIKYTPKDYYKNKWLGKKWVAVGDSLTAVNTRTTKHYHDYIKDYTGITVINMGESGTGYAKGDTYNFYTRIEGVPTDADVVTIFGSGNDIGSGLPIGNPTDNGTDSLCGYINGTIDKLIAIMPTVNLGIVSPTPWVGYAPSISNNTMLLYSQALKEICEIRSIPFLDLYHCSNLRPWTEEGRNACYSKDGGDGVHPDENGHKLIAPRFKAFLETLIL